MDCDLFILRLEMVQSTLFEKVGMGVGEESVLVGLLDGKWSEFTTMVVRMGANTSPKVGPKIVTIVVGTEPCVKSPLRWEGL